MSATWHEQTYVITGSSGAGKSAVCKLLANLGAKIIDADELSRQAIAKGSPGLAKVREIFGEKVFSGADLNRKALGEIVFNDPELKAKLENIIHPKVSELAGEEFSKLGTANKPIIYDCPLYFETKLKEKKFKGIILVTASDETKIERLVKRDGISPEQVRQRLANQLSDKEREPLVDFVVRNDGDEGDLVKKVENLYLKLEGRL